MKGKIRKNMRSSDDRFGFFQEATSNAFGFLITQYGFRQTATLIHAPECVLKYQNETTGVAISYEWESEIWVVLNRLECAGNEILEPEGYGLNLLTRERIGRAVPGVLGAGEWKNETIERIVREHADLLEKCGSDVLRGDFSVFPRLKQLSEERVRQRNIEVFGSETGET